MYMTLFASCLGCNRVFGCSPTHVPSFRSPSTGEKEPICPDCMAEINQVRESRGQEAFPIHPMAYEPEREEA
jgi:hypothetical protein